MRLALTHNLRLTDSEDEAEFDTRETIEALSTALYSRFESRGNADYANRMLSAMRFAFGGHVETKA